MQGTQPSEGDIEAFIDRLGGWLADVAMNVGPYPDFGPDESPE